MMARAVAISGAVLTGLAGCADRSVAPTYRVLDKLMIDEGIANILVETGGNSTLNDLDSFAECVAAGFALKQGRGFARHIRTNHSKTGGNWRADAVYSISPGLPEGPRTLDAKIVAQNCAERGIPTG